MNGFLTFLDRLSIGLDGFSLFLNRCLDGFSTGLHRCWVTMMNKTCRDMKTLKKVLKTVMSSYELMVSSCCTHLNIYNIYNDYNTYIIFHLDIVKKNRVNYIISPCGLTKIWLMSLNSINYGFDPLFLYYYST